MCKGHLGGYALNSSSNSGAAVCDAGHGEKQKAKTRRQKWIVTLSREDDRPTLRSFASLRMTRHFCFLISDFCFTSARDGPHVALPHPYPLRPRGQRADADDSLDARARRGRARSRRSRAAPPRRPGLPLRAAERAAAVGGGAGDDVRLDVVRW